MKLTRDDLMRMRLSTDIPYSYYVSQIKNFPQIDPNKPFYYREGSEHLGFLEERTISGFGFTWEGKRWTSTYKCFQIWDWNSDKPAQANPWVLFFLGCDDISFYKRFTSEQEALDEWNRLESLRYLDDLTMFN